MLEKAAAAGQVMMIKRGGKDRGLTLLEAVLILGLLMILAGLILPMFAKAKASCRVNCLSSLKQISLAMLFFSNDHEQLFPWNLPVENGGAKEWVPTGDPAPQFLAMMNGIVTPRVLKCCSDQKAVRATNFAGLSRTNISYFLCVEADENSPRRLLAGDRNITGGVFSNQLYLLPTKTGKADWGTNIHRSWGNIALADGSAERVDGTGLNFRLQTMTNQSVSLLVP